MKRIVLTGGGTAGHVTPNIALISKLKQKGYEIHYIGSYDGIEKELIDKTGVLYYGISSGKLRRYFDIKNLTDPFKVIKGYGEAVKLMKQLSPDVVFSKGGFVSVPVIFAAHKKGIPIILHESDMTPGLANKLTISKAVKICANFPETLNYLPKDKAVITGTPIRKELFAGNKIKGLDYCRFTSNKPVILVVGGSLGAAAINEAVRNLLPTLLKQFQVVHICGKGKMDTEYLNMEGYVQFEYVSTELSDIFAMADIVLSRAGANAICEILALKKPNILVPLSAAASRGDQILNAESFEKQGFSYVIQEEGLTNDTLLKGVRYVMENRDTYIEAMKKSRQTDAADTIIGLIESACKSAVGDL